MKKIFVLVLVVAFMMTMLVGCSGSATSDESTVSDDTSSDTVQATEEEKEPLRIAVMSFYCSSLLDVILEQNWPEEDGIEVEYVMFSNGATINEAMGEWDVAITGGAFIYALANYDCKLVAHQINGTAGNDIMARVGDPILDTYGAVVDGVAGTPEMIEGKTFLTAFGTTSHYALLQWMEAIGADPEDCNLINQDQATVYQSWVAGEGDYAVMTSPYCFYDWEGDSEVIASLESVGGELLEACVATSEAYENRYDDVVKFTEWVYKATDMLAADYDYAFEIVKNYYNNAGKEVTDDDVLAELTNKPFITSAMAKELDFGDFATKYGEYFISQGMIDEDKLETIKENIATDVFEEALSAF